MAAGSDGAMTHNEQSPGLLGLPGEGQRLAFGKAMAAAATGKILPPGSYGQKAVAPSGAITVPQAFVQDPIALGQPATSLLSVLPVQVQSSPQFAYLRQTVRTNNAAVVPEGTLKPTSIYSVILVEDQLDVIAHLSEPVPRYWLIDSPQLQQFLTNELTYGLSVAVEAKALLDIGATSGIQANAFSTSVLQTLLKSLTKCEVNAAAPAAAFVLHPADFENHPAGAAVRAGCRVSGRRGVRTAHPQIVGGAHRAVHCGHRRHRVDVRTRRRRHERRLARSGRAVVRDIQRRRLQQKPHQGQVRSPLRHKRLPAARCGEVSVQLITGRVPRAWRTVTVA
jgi:hypothetical protein